jgi:hypothetical protein
LGDLSAACSAAFKTDGPRGWSERIRTFVLHTWCNLVCSSIQKAVCHRLACPAALPSPTGIRTVLRIETANPEVAAFENRTKLPRYEALEKNGVSSPQSPKRGHLSYGATSAGGPIYRVFRGCGCRSDGNWNRSGGGRGTGIEPSPRSPRYSRVARRIRCLLTRAVGSAGGALSGKRPSEGRTARSPQIGGPWSGIGLPHDIRQFQHLSLQVLDLSR